MSHRTNPGHILAQDIDPPDAIDQSGPGAVISLTEIEELLYGEDRPAEDRLQRLREFQEQMIIRQTRDFGDNDANSLLDEIERAITRLSGATHEFEDPDDSGYDDAIPGGFDPADHRETLAPDDDLLLDIEDADEESMQGDPVVDDVDQELLVAENEDGRDRSDR